MQITDEISYSITSDDRAEALCLRGMFSRTALELRAAAGDNETMLACAVAFDGMAEGDGPVAVKLTSTQLARVLALNSDLAHYWDELGGRLWRALARRAHDLNDLPADWMRMVERTLENCPT